jgi:hypothetical protein
MDASITKIFKVTTKISKKEMTLCTKEITVKRETPHRLYLPIREESVGSKTSIAKKDLMLLNDVLKPNNSLIIKTVYCLEEDIQEAETLAVTSLCEDVVQKQTDINALVLSMMRGVQIVND